MIGSRPTGLGVYASNLTDITNLFRSRIISSDGSLLGSDGSIASPKNIVLGSGRMAAIFRQLWLRGLKVDPADLVYSPTHHAIRHKKQIITIHDLISLRFPRQHYSQYLYFKYKIPQILKDCVAVFTVSQATRHDISRTYNYPIDRIHVVPNSINPSSLAIDEATEPQPYLLMVGARYSHKNVEEVIANADLWKSHYKLIVTSCGGKYRSHLEDMVSTSNLKGSVDFLDYIDRDSLIKLYRDCTALIYPSKWEGFGIPPLESLACGRPVIVSDIPAHREVLDDSAFFVRLGDRASWKKAFISIESGDAVSEKLNLGKTRLSVYTKSNALLALESALLQVAPDLERP